MTGKKRKDMATTQILTHASRQVFSLRAPTQPVKPIVKVIKPKERHFISNYLQHIVFTSFSYFVINLTVLTAMSACLLIKAVFIYLYQYTLVFHFHNTKHFNHLK